MNDYEGPRTAAQRRQMTTAEWWAAHPEEHEPRASRALGIALVVLAGVAILAGVAWIVAAL